MTTLQIRLITFNGRRCLGTGRMCFERQSQDNNGYRWGEVNGYTLVQGG